VLPAYSASLGDVLYQSSLRSCWFSNAVSRWSLLGLYTHGMPLAHKLLFMFDTLLQKHVPALAQHLQKEMVRLNFFSWAMAAPTVVRLFVNVLLELRKRLFHLCALGRFIPLRLHSAGSRCDSLNSPR